MLRNKPKTKIFKYLHYFHVLFWDWDKLQCKILHIVQQGTCKFLKNRLTNAHMILGAVNIVSFSHEISLPTVCTMFIFTTQCCYMFRPYILTIFRELQLWSTCTEFMATCYRLYTYREIHIYTLILQCLLYVFIVYYYLYQQMHI